MTKRLSILEASLDKKKAAFDEKLGAHFASVKAANGQPLNDKRNGAATMKKWEKQNDSLRTLQDGIATTTAAIEREKAKIANVQSLALPPAIQAMVNSGELIQWRRHPNTFFVAGVDKARIVWLGDDKLAHRYLSDVPADQYPRFRDVFNQLRGAIAKNNSGSTKP